MTIGSGRDSDWFFSRAHGQHMCLLPLAVGLAEK